MHEKDLQDDLDYRMAVEKQKAAGNGEKGAPGAEAKTNADVMKSVPRKDAMDAARFSAGKKVNNVDIYLDDLAGLEQQQADKQVKFWDPANTFQEPKRYVRKDVIVGERFEVLKGEEVVPTFIGPMQRELFRFEELFDDKLGSFLQHVYTDIVAKSSAFE